MVLTILIMKYLKIIVILFCLSCNSDKGKTLNDTSTKIANYIEGHVQFIGLRDNDFSADLNRFNFSLQRLESVKSCSIFSNNNYFLEFDKSYPELLNIFFEDVFVTPGDTLKIDLVFNSNTQRIEKFKVKGKNYANYTYYYELKRANILKPVLENYNGDFVTYRKKLVEYKIKKWNHFLSFIKHNSVTPTFFNYVKQNLELEFWANLTEVVYFPTNVKKNLTTSYFDGLVVKVGSDDSKITNTNYCIIIRNYISLLLIKENRFSLNNDYFQRSITMINNLYKGKTKDYLLFDLVKKYEKERKGKTYSKEILQSFNKIKDEIISEDFKEAISRCDLDGRARFRLTQELKEAKLGNINGQSVTFNDLLKRRRTLYIDFWASWCKPCLQELKFASQTNEFLKSEGCDYILIDAHEGVFEKWKKLNKKYKLEKYETYYAYDVGSFSAIMNTFDVTVIPKFIIIGSNGEVSTFNAPRPSDKSFKRIVKNLLH